MIYYNKIISQFPWIIASKQKCILSPDSDGFLCGLLMTKILNWEVVGYYDGKVMALKDGYNYTDCIFLDMDINRTNVKSVGHHMVKYNKRLIIPNFNYKNCIQPNNIRDFDGKENFQSKYPFGTIHLLYGILQTGNFVDTIPDEGLIPLLFVDGVFNNLLGYPENCLNWIDYLGIHNEEHILHKLYFHENHNLYDIMTGLNDFFKIRDEYNAKGFYDGNNFIERKSSRTGHQLKISNTSGEKINLQKTQQNIFKVYDKEKNRVIGFISKMGAYIDLGYNEEKWCWDNLRIKIFKKGILGGGSKYGNLNNVTYTSLMQKNPFSLAMTSGNQIEYTLI
jgi:hypothetical protein